MEDSKKTPSPNDGALFDEIAIPPEEREEISEEIHRLLLVSRKLVEVDIENLQPLGKRSGLFVPLLIIGGLVLFSGIFAVVSFLLFSQGREQQITRSQTFYSPDSQLIREILYQSNTRVQEKEREIAAIQDQLQNISVGLRALEESIESSVEARRKELEESFARELSRLEEELQSQSYSEEEVQQLLEEAKEQAEVEIASELLVFREMLILQQTEKEADLVRVKGELEAALEAQEEEVTLLTQRINAQTQFLQEQQSSEILAGLQQEVTLNQERDQGYEALLQEQRRREALDEQINGAIMAGINDAIQGTNTIDTAQALVVLQSEDTVALLGSSHVSVNIRMLELLGSYKLLREQLKRRQEEDVEIIAPPIFSDNEEDREGKLGQIRKFYLSQASKIINAPDSAALSDLKRSRESLLAPFLSASDVFPGLKELFFNLDNRIEDLSNTQAQWEKQQTVDTVRVQTLSDVETVVGAALGNPRLQIAAQRLIQDNRRFAQIYSNVRGERTQGEESAIESNEREIFGYVTSALSRGAFSVNKISLENVKLGDIVEVYRGESSDQVLIGTGIIIRVDGNNIQCQINNQGDSPIEILENDVVYHRE